MLVNSKLLYKFAAATENRLINTDYFNPMRMKYFQICIIVLSCFLAFACSQDGSEPIVQDSSDNMNVKLRSQDQAIEIARSAAAIFGDKFCFESRSAGEFSVQVRTARPGSRSDVEDTLMYIVNFPDNGGFCIVGAPEQSPALIGISDVCNFSDDMVNNDSNFDFYLRHADAYVRQCVTTAPEAADVEDQESRARELLYKFEFIDKISPYCKDNHWGQNDPEGKYCPNGLSGCIVTASVLVLSHLELPKTARITFPGAPKSEITIDWTSLKKHKGNILKRIDRIPDLSDHPDQPTDEDLDNLGLLCREIGYQCNVDYQTSPNWVTLGTKEVLHKTLRMYAPAYHANSNSTNVCVDSVLNFELFKEKLQSHPLVLCGKVEGWHAWICDAYAVANMYRNNLFVIGSSNGSGLDFLGTVNLLHMNWGMDGKGDGYFMCDALNPYDRWIPDVNTDTGTDSQYILPSIFFFDIQTL